MAKKRYRVIAEDTVVAGHKTGEEFSFDFSEGYDEQALLDGGHLELVEASKSSKSTDEKEG